MIHGGRVYFDNNATTAVADTVLNAMLPYLREHYGNPSSPHGFARAPAMAISRSREQLADLLGAEPSHFIFTSGGTEGNAAAVLGSLQASSPRNEVVFSAVEHVSVMAWCDRLIEQGFKVHIAPVNRDGNLDLDMLAGLLNERTALVSVMMANNETGILYPVNKIADMAHAVGALVHTDAAQSAGKIPVNFRALGVDFATVCGHKFHAVKGIGALYIRDAKKFRPLMLGGEQEFGRRPGTEPVPSIVALGAAATLAKSWLTGENSSRQQKARDELESWLVSSIPRAIIAGQKAPRLPNTTMALISGVETEPLLALLDMAGVAASSGSACASGAHEPSRVLAAMGADVTNNAVIRISSSRFTRDEDFEYLRTALAGSVRRLLAAASR
ncbi:MAG TPA: aminotransferase class V-fold PLP-dependent enzyme [Kiritimatiellia bacterium]|nr:aminotransferase class V-fold PLP-dependent enzyme [Kiritimatiellia bacterium]